ncbi:MAG TPA: UDP-N-acetylmuramoyl-L-alanyl-D-glutamate--2,6-diaminopimelate ligase [Acidiferrobacterales bacterium]
MTPSERPLSELLAGLSDAPVLRDVGIRGVSADSRVIEPGWLFLAAPGVRGDGRDHIVAAVARGAAAVAYEPAGRRVDTEGIAVPALPVAGLRERAGIIADRFFGAPSRRMFVVGVTGTNGKTTCTHLVAQALDAPDRRCGLIGTLGSGYPGALDPGLHTTPDPVSVHRLLAGFAAAGAHAVCMEVSSHALDQGRVQGVAFDVAVLTNLTRDHLDYHGSLDAYAAAKARLFDFPELKAAVINADDALGRELIGRLAGRLKLWRFGAGAADLRAVDIRPSPEGLELEVATPLGAVTLKSPLLGRFNADNLLAALAVLLEHGLALDQAVVRLARARPVAGRMERFGGAGAPLVVVDYAHTPDALAKALAALREHTRGRLICVFGCGGDRDRGKRPEMGRLAEQLADVVILTDDNPRHEDPQQIVADIAAGMQRTPSVVRDRAHAIRLAIAEAGRGDSVLVAGKGHEDYQQVGAERRPFSDRQVVAQLLGGAA